MGITFAEGGVNASCRRMFPNTARPLQPVSAQVRLSQGCGELSIPVHTPYRGPINTPLQF